MVKLTTLEIGTRVRLLDFGDAPLSYRRKLLSLGLTRGSEIEIIRKAPLGCPLQIEVRGTAITLRKAEVERLTWEKV